MTAVLVKEWRRILRAPATPWALAVYVLLPAVIAGVYLKFSQQSQVPGMVLQVVPLLGAQALANVATWQVLLLAVGTPWISAGMLAAEAEERTLDPYLAGGGGLLSAVAAKLLAAVLFFALVMAAGLPAFALPWMVGGINWALVGRVLALEGATVVLMAGLGLLLSSFGRRSGSATLAGIALGLALTLGTGLAAGLGGGPGATGANIKEMMARGIPVNSPTTMPKWLLTNPLVGLNSALDNPDAPALLGLPGANTAEMVGKYHLWQVQIAAGGALGLVSLVLAWLAMTVRLRWRRPGWLLRWKGRRKAVAANG